MRGAGGSGEIFLFFKQKTAYEFSACLVGSEVCIRNRYSKWDNDSIPRKVTLIKIADYFGVTPESLVAENEQKKVPSEMDGEEKILFIKQKYSRLTEDERKALEQFADYLLDKREKTSQGDSDNQ